MTVLELPTCGFCGLEISKNPHPDAGKPATLCEVGAVWVCIPCQSKALHNWCGRALDAERTLSEIMRMARPQHADPEPDLERYEYEAEFAAYLIEKRYHPEDAVRFATEALDEMLKDEGIKYGDPSFGWDKDSGREHAFNWLEQGK